MIRLDETGIIAATQRDLAPFRLTAPRSLVEAADFMAGGAAPVAYAGGTDLCAQIREGLKIETLVWLRHVGELRTIRQTDDELQIGALTTHADAARNAALKQVPGLAEAWGKVANVRIRWTATLGGNLMARRTRYELSILMQALDAKVRFAAKAGPETVRPAAIWEGGSPEGGILERITIPLAGAPRLDYDRSLRPIMTQACAIRGGKGAHWSGRAVIATEYLPPFAMDLDLSGVTDAADLARGAVEVAEAAYRVLPGCFGDPATGHSYLKKAGTALLARQLRRMGDSNERAH